jgi:hypothetical protein
MSGRAFIKKTGRNRTALTLGLRTVERWSDGGMTNIEEGLEQGWVFGRWLEPEE